MMGLNYKKEKENKVGITIQDTELKQEKTGKNLL